MVCVEDGEVKVQTPSSGASRCVWQATGSGLYLWRSFESPAAFVQFTRLESVRNLRVAYMEPVTGPVRLVLDLSAPAVAPADGRALAHPGATSREAFLLLCVVPFLAALAESPGRPQPFVLDEFEVVDASAVAGCAFRLVAKRAVLQSKHARSSFAARLSRAATHARVEAYTACGSVARLVKSPSGVARGVHRPALRPLSAHGVLRLCSGEQFVSSDFSESAQPSFYTPTCFQPLEETEVRRFSLSAALVADPEVLDPLLVADEPPAAVPPPWLAACVAKLLDDWVQAVVDRRAPVIRVARRRLGAAIVLRRIG